MLCRNRQFCDLSLSLFRGKKRSAPCLSRLGLGKGKNAQSALSKAYGLRRPLQRASALGGGGANDRRRHRPAGNLLFRLLAPVLLQHDRAGISVFCHRLHVLDRGHRAFNRRAPDSIGYCIDSDLCEKNFRQVLDGIHRCRGRIFRKPSRPHHLEDLRHRSLSPQANGKIRGSFSRANHAGLDHAA